MVSWGVRLFVLGGNELMGFSWSLDAFEIPEKELVADILFVLQGIDGKYIRYSETLDSFQPDPTVTFRFISIDLKLVELNGYNLIELISFYYISIGFEFSGLNLIDFLGWNSKTSSNVNFKIK